MDEPEIRIAGLADMELLHTALENLSAYLDDRHLATAKDLAAACLGPHPACHGMLAVVDGAAVGAALLSPVFSTSLGGAGVYVSDLWVAAEMRGTGLGRRLLRRAAAFGEERWQTRFVRLTVWTENSGARAFYERLGFRTDSEEMVLNLSGDELQDLTGETA